MHIVSINTEHTTADTVVFNAVQVLSDDVFSNINFGGLDVNLRDGLLHVRQPDGVDLLGPEVVVTLNELLGAARKTAEAEEKAKVQAKKELLAALSAKLDVPLDRKQDAAPGKA